MKFYPFYVALPLNNTMSSQQLAFQYIFCHMFVPIIFNFITLFKCHSYKVVHNTVEFFPTDTKLFQPCNVHLHQCTFLGNVQKLQCGIKNDSTPHPNSHLSVSLVSSSQATSAHIHGFSIYRTAPCIRFSFSQVTSLLHWVVNSVSFSCAPSLSLSCKVVPEEMALPTRMTADRTVPFSPTRLLVLSHTLISAFSQGRLN